MDPSQRDYRDLIGGGLLMALGLFAALYASQHYDMGALRHLGPGMFPTVLGFTLAGLGLAIFLPAWFRHGAVPIPEFRPLIAVLLSIVAFALIVDHFGLVPALFALVFAAVHADNRLGPTGTLLLAAALSAIAVLVFRLILGISLDPFRWPFHVFAS